jgi:hypothetical protein
VPKTPEIIITQEPMKAVKDLWKKSASSAGILTQTMGSNSTVSTRSSPKKSDAGAAQEEVARDATSAQLLQYPEDGLWIKASDNPNLTQYLIDAVSHGIVLMVIGIDCHQLPISFDNVKNKQFSKDEDGCPTYMIIDKNFRCHERFSLIFVTSLRDATNLGKGCLNLNFSSFLDASISMEHLAGSLLSKLMHMDRSDFDSARRKFEGQLMNFEQQKKEKQDNLLRMTSTLTRSLLEDKTISIQASPTVRQTMLRNDITN